VHWLGNAGVVAARVDLLPGVALMHTYYRGDTLWVVVFDSGEPNQDRVDLFNTDNQMQAAELTSWLNGGAKPKWLTEVALNEVTA